MSLKDFHDKTLYLIEILHQTTTLARPALFPPGCILSKFYIKPQQKQVMRFSASCCILSKFYIKPQLLRLKDKTDSVVSYRNSTSNHNTPAAVLGSSGLYLIEILHQTTTSSPIWIRNRRLYLIEILHQTTTKQVTRFSESSLYLIEILHQTTTPDNQYRCKSELYLIEILHQTTTLVQPVQFPPGCILSKFYIKPQHD